LAPGVGDGEAAWDSTSLLFAWRKAYRAGALVAAAPTTSSRVGSLAAIAGFVPAVVVEERPAATPPAPSRIEIVTPNGHRVLVDADVDEAALTRVLSVLARA
jgi:hypothetical protein